MRWMNLMLAAVPISIALHFFHAPPGLAFIVACLAIIPLAGYIGVATEEVAKYRGPAVGGLLNATFGNATELIIAIVALQSGQIEVVKASLIGSILGNILLVLGLSILAGGLKYKVQTFSQDLAGMHSATLLMAVIALLVPALFARNSPGFSELATNAPLEHLSLAVAGVLIVIYIGSLLFSLGTHQDWICDDTNSGESEKPTWKQSTAMLALFVATVFIAIESEFLVHSIEPVVKQWKVSALFIGIIVVPIIGNAAEHSTAVIMAMRNKVEISLNIAVSSSTQIAMFVAPVVIFASVLFGKPMTILFSNPELIAVAVSTMIVSLIARDGKFHWLEGAQLLACYIVIALAFYFIPV